MNRVSIFALAAAMFAEPTRADDVFFETRIRPVLAEHCYSCHGPDKQRGDVRVDRREFLVAPRDEGPLVVPGQPAKSRLVRAVRHEGEYKMPPKAKLPDAVVADLTEWIRAGAVWPAEKTAVDAKADWRTHWAFRPITDPAIPVVKNPDAVRTSVDAFVQAALEAKGIAPHAEADRRTLLRRLKFDLLGLPPTFDEVEAFVRDPDPNAYDQLVERYLASPHYGERWGRYWLDVARYADNKGYVFLEERRYAYSYTYRDWVTKAFNDDLPFDQFVMQQIAADRLVARGEAPIASQAAMGFLTLARRFLNNTHDIIDDRIDVVTRGLLGLTAQCSRCHDHKFDPIPARDYYSLYGVFASSVEPADLPLVSMPEATDEYEAFRAELGRLEGAVRKFAEENKKGLAEKNRDLQNRLRELQKKVDGYKATSPIAPPRAMVMVDGPVHEPVVFLRGNPGNRGPRTPRQFLEAASGPNRTPFVEGSGRLELARALVADDNPLTARVFVNRVWLNHFGAGLVRTPSDFGVRTEAPSHPELLDHLATRFRKDGWSVKNLHRLIVRSAAYRRSSAEHTAAATLDPENRLLARHSRHRLDFEALRDSVLFAAGTLDPRIGGRPVDIVAPGASTRRTLYGFIDRQNLPGLFRTFDFANPDTTSPARHETTVPQQALFLLNSPFLLQQTRALAARDDVARETGPARVKALFRAVLARDPDAEETALAEAFVRDAVVEMRLGQLTPWERLGQALILSNEFAFAD